MITGKLLSENLNPQLACYPANLPTTVFGCVGANWKWLSFQWATPVTNNGMTITSFSYTKAIDSVITPPSPDSFKTLLVQWAEELGSYRRIVVPNNYLFADVNALCATNGTIPAVTIPTPIIPSYQGVIIGNAVCATPVYTTSTDAGAITGFTNYILTPTGYDLTGAAITFSPTTVTSTTVAGLATAAQTAWATILGTGTFTANGTVITATGTNFSSLALTISKT